MKKMILELPLIGRCEVLLSNHLTEFVRRQFINYFIEYTDIHTSNANYTATLSFNNTELVNTFKKYAAKNLSLSRNGCWDHNIITVNGYMYVLSEDTVTINVLKKGGIKSFVKKALSLLRGRTEERKYDMLGGLFYQNVLFPIFSIYAAGYGLYTVHGSLIHLNSGENIILSGLDGVGKSTLSDMLCKELGNVLLADNIVLFDGASGLNLNLAMRLEHDAETEQEVIYANRDIKEVIPKEKRMGLVLVDEVIVLLKGNDNRIETFDAYIPAQDWVMFVEGAPEIGQANGVLSYWLFMYTLLFTKNSTGTNIKSIAIPNGRLMEAKELILK